MSDLPNRPKPGMLQVSRNGTDQPAWKSMLEQATGQSLASRDRAVFMLVDTSSSMGAASKLTGAVQGAVAFLDDAISRGFDVGIIEFATDAKIILDLQGKSETHHQALARLKVGGTTNLAAAISLAEEKLSGVRRERIICIVTDGVPDNREDALGSAQSAKMRAIDIMAIGTDDADEAFLARLVSRRELARKVIPAELGSSLASMALLLPKS